MCVCVCVCVYMHARMHELCSVMSDSAILWTVAHQALLSMKFSRQEYWSGLPFSPPRDLLDPGIEPMPPALAGGFFNFIYFLFGWAVSSLLHRLFSSGSKWVQLSGYGVQACVASHLCGFSCCRRRALGARAASVAVTQAEKLQLPGSGAQAQKLWLMGLVALGFSWIKD